MSSVSHATARPRPSRDSMIKHQGKICSRCSLAFGFAGRLHCSFTHDTSTNPKSIPFEAHAPPQHLKYLTFVLKFPILR